MNRMKMLRVFALLLALTLVLSLVACGNAGTTTPSTGTQVVETTTTVAPEIIDYPWEKSTDPVELTTALRTDSSVVQLDQDTWDDNLWTREIEKTFNIKVKNIWMADQSQYNTKLNVSIASGDLPDVYSVTNQQLAQIIKSDLAYDLSSVYEKYASPALKHLMDIDKVGFESGKVDGKLLGISAQHFGLVSIPNLVWIRDDWMKKFNLAAPETMADLINICETFTTKDPDGNGKNDTYGLAVSKNLFDTPLSATGLALVDGILNAYHANPGIWIKDASGQIVYGTIQPEMKAGLAVLQDMYKKGIISKEFGLKDSGKIAEDFAAGKVGVEMGGNWNGYWPAPDVVKKYGEAAILMPYAIPSADDKPIKLNTSWPINRYYVVNKDCKNPEAALKIANLYQKLNTDSTPEDYTRFFVGSRSWNCPVAITDPDQSNREYAQVSEALTSKDASKLTGSSLGKYTEVLKWTDTKNPDSVGYWLQLSSVGSFSILKKFIDEGNYVMTEYRGIDTPTMTKKGSTLEKLEKETITKIIMGASLDEFDKMVESWKKLGGDDITKEMNTK